MKNLTFANHWNAELIDQYYDTWLENPENLDPHWRAFFEGFELAQSKSFTDAAPPKEMAAGEASIINAINAYRSIGHTQAHINPLDSAPKKNPALSFESLGFQEADLNKRFFTGNYLGGITLPVREIFDRLNQTYCGSIGCEYMHIHDLAKRHWLESQMEPTFNQPQFSQDKKIHILRKTYHAEIFERFLHTRYVGQKRFSLEGGETMIPALDAIIQKSPSLGVKEILIGMAHRGRLNVLANIMDKSYSFIFKEFSANYIPESTYGDGDVKYHLGYDNIRSTLSGEKISLCLAANPSHLEAVNPVVEGQTRARQRFYDKRTKVLPILIHGDAAIAGQGIVAEVLNLSKLDGYRTSGTLHFVVNNQIGFTTNPEESRSSRYCTDIAKMIEAPIFHVNGDDPLAVVAVMDLALMYRQQFEEDVVVDMYCYRKHGHNESDEPAFTQPILYKKIAKQRLVSEVFVEKLIQEGTLTQEQSNTLKKEFEENLDNAFTHVKKEEENKAKGKKPKAVVLVQQPPYHFKAVKTGVPLKTLQQVAKALTHIPDDFKANPKIKRQLKTKWKIIQDGEGIDWGLAEALSFGTLLNEGTPVRLSGQDSERGTFSHRHAVLYDSETRASYVPLNNIHKDQSPFSVYNSSLSEASVLGFDFGYTLDYPQMLCLWEAQFGDFANGAQVIIDQFISCCESKWQRYSNIVLLLPHGYEGQGPEHSSARLERYLQLCGDENIQVCNTTTPAQYFHLLRKQIKQNVIKPLVIMTPKSLLRHKECTSSVKDLVSGHFEYILDDPQVPKKPERIILCSGKVYYDLHAHRKAKNLKNAVILRAEQLYPFDDKKLQALFKKYQGFKKLIWCQEEPKNMGAWHYILPRLQEISKISPIYIGRKPAASPATGLFAVHKKEQETLVSNAFSK